MEKEAGIEIIELPPDDWRQLKDLRLRALKEVPEAFGKTYEEELKTTEKEWREKLSWAKSGKARWYVFAREENCLVGMVGAYAERGIRVEHIANIVGVYVAPEARRKGVGKKLMEKIMERLELAPNIVKISLRVNTKQEDAVKLYENLGFKKVALLKKELKVGETFQDEYEMCRFIE